jgi:lipid-binding SYLF domain-containing protein
MSGISRRGLILSGGSLLGLAACGNGIGSQGAAKLDGRVDATRDYLRNNYHGVADLMPKAAGILYMPLVTEAGLIVGGSYGQGALRINDVTVDYYSATQASWGIQIGAQQYAHALFFMTPEALADIVYALPDRGGSAGVDTTTTLDPVIGYIFGQSGFIAGATLKGTKYTRIIP